MNSGTVVFTAVLILKVTLSHQNHDYASGKQAKRAWRKAVKAGKTTGTTIIVINADGDEVGRRDYSYSAICKDGYSFSKLFADGTFKCKKGPGRRRRVKCSNFYGTIRSLNCPGFKYISAYWIAGTTIKYRCCGERKITYSDENCAVKRNEETVNGETHKVSEGKFWTGFGSEDSGITWNNYECQYDTRTHAY